MSLTLRGMISNGWNTFLRVNPLTGPYFLAQDLAKTRQFQDAVKITAETTNKVVEQTQRNVNAVLDYDIGKGAQQAGDAIAKGYDTSVRAVGQFADDTYHAGVHAYEGAVDATGQAIETAVDGVQETGKAIANGYNEYVIQPTVDTIIKTGQVIDETGKAIDQGQKDVRRGIADWIAPD